MYTKKIFTGLLSVFISIPAFSQYGNLITSNPYNNETNVIDNRKIYPYLHQWDDNKTDILINKIKNSIQSNQKHIGFINHEDSTIESFILKQNVYYSSLCLEKSLYNNPFQPNTPSSPEKIKTLLGFANLLNFKDENFTVLDVNSLNTYCMNAIDSDWNKWYCQKAKNTTVLSKVSIGESVIPMAINITRKETELPKRAPIDCVINNMTPGLLFTYKTPITYKITKPFENKQQLSSLGYLNVKVGEAIVTANNIVTISGQPLSWNTKIIQH